MKSNLTIISGGQTGVDRAALDFALQHGIETGGWCPKLRLAEDGTIPEQYPVKEIDSEEYDERTRHNVCDSDGTLVFISDDIDEGTQLTLDLADEFNKPLFIVSLKTFNNNNRIKQWLENHHIKTLNIAGPSESNSPGIYKAVLQFLTINATLLMGHSKSNV